MATTPLRTLPLQQVTALFERAAIRFPAFSFVGRASNDIRGAIQISQHKAYHACPAMQVLRRAHGAVCAWDHVYCRRWDLASNGWGPVLRMVERPDYSIDWQPVPA